MNEDLESRARKVADVLMELSDGRSRALSRGITRGSEPIRDSAFDALADLAEIVRVLVAEVSSQ